MCVGSITPPHSAPHAARVSTHDQSPLSVRQPKTPSVACVCLCAHAVAFTNTEGGTCIINSFDSVRRLTHHHLHSCHKQYVSTSVFVMQTRGTVCCFCFWWKHTPHAGRAFCPLCCSRVVTSVLLVARVQLCRCREFVSSGTGFIAGTNCAFENNHNTTTTRVCR